MCPKKVQSRGVPGYMPPCIFSRPEILHIDYRELASLGIGFQHVFRAPTQLTAADSVHLKSHDSRSLQLYSTRAPCLYSEDLRLT